MTSPTAIAPPLTSSPPVSVTEEQRSAFASVSKKSMVLGACQGYDTTMNATRGDKESPRQARRSRSPKPPISNPFLHSGEHMRENEDDGKEFDFDAKKNERVNGSCSRPGRHAVGVPITQHASATTICTEERSHKERNCTTTTTTGNSAVSNTGNLFNWQNWPRRHMHRSMSVDDMLEYQRQFNSIDQRVSGGASSLARLDLAEHRQEFQKLFTEQWQQHHNKPLPLPEEEGDKKYNSSQLVRSKGTWGGRAAAATAGANKRIARKSIANSDLLEFKRQQSQEALEGEIYTSLSEESNFDKDALLQDNRKNEPPSSRTEGTDNYQWGTQGLPKSILGSDLTKFKRSVKTALLVSSRENSCDSFDGCKADSEETADENTKKKTQQTMFRPTHSLEEKDWGTRSLRRSIQQLELIEDDSYSYFVAADEKNSRTNHQCETVYENGIDQEFAPPLRSPWRDDDNIRGATQQPRRPCRVTSDEQASASPLRMPQRGTPTLASAKGLKMPKRVSSVGSPDYGMKQPHRVNSDDSNSSNNNSSTAIAQSPLAVSSEDTEFRRSRFRRSISSSDIEKYQRHAAESIDELGHQPNDDTNDVQDELEGSSRSISGAEAFQNSRGNIDPLLQAADMPPWSPDAVDDLPSAEIKRKHKHHRRSTSDVPEFHMDDVIADVAPRKPRRTDSRADSPGPYEERLCVRFAEDQTTVVEIPKVSEEMKPYLFYTKRDVKRFRMNEHRRQELQIKEYMEYLNQRQNALEPGSPSMFG